MITTIIPYTYTIDWLLPDILLDTLTLHPVLGAINLPRSEFLDVVHSSRLSVYCRTSTASCLDEE